jgi:hypothetical protein
MEQVGLRCHTRLVPLSRCLRSEQAVKRPPGAALLRLCVGEARLATPLGRGEQQVGARERRRGGAGDQALAAEPGVHQGYGKEVETAQQRALPLRRRPSYGQCKFKLD